MFVWWLACSQMSQMEGAPPVEPVRAGVLALSYAPEPDESELSAQLARVRSHPDTATAWTALAVTLLNRARESGSDVYLQYADDAAAAALQIDGEDLVAEQVRIRVQHDRHRFTEVAQRAAAIAARHPEDSTALLLHADALLELGSYEEALNVVQRALDLRPDLRTYNRGAHLRWVYGDLNGAIELQVSAIGAGGAGLPEPTAFCYVDLAQLQLHAGRPDLALQAVDAALKLVPDYPLARSAQARSLAAAGRSGEAIDLLIRLGERASLADRYLLADLLDARGDGGEAGETRAAADARSSVDPRAVATDLARHRRDVARAVSLASAAATERPTVENLDTLALALLRAGRIDEALAASDRAVALGTADPRLHLSRGLIAAAVGDRAGAQASLQRAGEAGRMADGLLYAELRAAAG